VHNFMSRTVSVYDASGVTDSTTFALPLRASVSVVANETLSPQVLRGKQLFYDASDPRMNEDGYLSCASCHLDGGQDGRTWDFTDRGEGLRNTISLVGRRGTGHGNVHWTANFDEIQDFENDIRAHFGGDGFMSNALFPLVANPLGEPKAGRSEELDALAAYVSSLTEFGRSPYREPDGNLTAAGGRGRLLFQQLACAQCHAGADFTDSASGVLHDVGTLSPSSGQASGEPLVGLDTPTLRGLWATAPYLHDGSAPTLLDVLTTKNPLGSHGATTTLPPQDQADLVEYLLQIDDLELSP
jgi:cytochrome c peroxidase